MPKKSFQQKPQTKAEFVAKVAGRLPISQKEAGLFVNTVLDVLTDTMAQGIAQQFVGFGTFATRDRPERMGRNPRTGNAVLIEGLGVHLFLAQAIN